MEDHIGHHRASQLINKKLNLKIKTNQQQKWKNPQSRRKNTRKE